MSRGAFSRKCGNCGAHSLRALCAGCSKDIWDRELNEDILRYKKLRIENKKAITALRDNIAYLEQQIIFERQQLAQYLKEEEEEELQEIAFNEYCKNEKIIEGAVEESKLRKKAGTENKLLEAKMVNVKTGCRGGKEC